MTPTASDLFAAGWLRVFVGRTKHGGMRHVWRHPDHDKDFTYQQAMSALLKERKAAKMDV